MIQALFYKEWMKTRRGLLLATILLVALIVYAFVHTNQQFRLNGAVMVWSSVVLKELSILPEMTKWFPLAVALLIGLIQFIPEMVDKRLKLTLHLPLPETRILSAMLLYGVGLLCALYLLMYATLSVGLRLYYTSEMMNALNLQLLPYFLGGLTGYLFVAWVCLEPVWRQRIFHALAAVGGLYLFYMDAKQGTYSTFLPYLAILLIVAFCFPFYSTARFKEGAQR
jgi:drug/metabolite transporter superfamily protein YnfA